MSISMHFFLEKKNGHNSKSRDLILSHVTSIYFLKILKKIFYHSNILWFMTILMIYSFL